MEKTKRVWWFFECIKIKSWANNDAHFVLHLNGNDKMLSLTVENAHVLTENKSTVQVQQSEQTRTRIKSQSKTKCSKSLPLCRIVRVLTSKLSRVSTTHIWVIENCSLSSLQKFIGILLMSILSIIFDLPVLFWWFHHFQCWICLDKIGYR